MKRVLFISFSTFILVISTGLISVNAANHAIPLIQQLSVKVKKGDSLYELSKKYHTTIKEFKSLNNLKSNTINVGQSLKTYLSDCSKLNIPQNKELDTYYDKKNKLIVAIWYDNSKKEDVQAIIDIGNSKCSVSVKRLISHVENTN